MRKRILHYDESYWYLWNVSRFPLFDFCFLVVSSVEHAWSAGDYGRDRLFFGGVLPGRSSLHGLYTVGVWWTGPFGQAVVGSGVRGPCMINVSVNKAGSIFNVMSTHKAVVTDNSIGARTCSAMRRCMSRIYGGLLPLVVSRNKIRGVGNVNVNTPGKGCCDKAVRFTPGLP